MSDSAELFNKLRGYIDDIAKINPLKPENLNTVQNELEQIYDRHAMLRRPIKALRRLSVSGKTK